MSNSNSNFIQSFIKIVILVVVVLLIFQYLFYPIPELSFIFGNHSPLIWLNTNIDGIIIILIITALIVFGLKLSAKT